MASTSVMCNSVEISRKVSRDQNRKMFPAYWKLFFLLSLCVSPASHLTSHESHTQTNVLTSTTTTRPRPPEPIYFLCLHPLAAFSSAQSVEFASTAIYFPSDHLCHHGSYWGNYRWEREKKLRYLKSMVRRNVEKALFSHLEIQPTRHAWETEGNKWKSSIHFTVGNGIFPFFGFLFLLLLSSAGSIYFISEEIFLQVPRRFISL